jgi:hypothetical protein
MQRRGVTMGALWNDLRYSLRTLRKSPGFTAVVILTLALGIGANTTIFSVIDGVFLKPLPFPDPDRLVMVWQHDVRDPDDHNIISLPNYLDWKQQNHVFQNMAIFDSAGKSYSLSGERNPEQVSGLRVSASFLTCWACSRCWDGRLCRRKKSPDAIARWCSASVCGSGAMEPTLGSSATPCALMATITP